MAMKHLGKWLYGGVFALVLPLGLVAWAVAAAAAVRLPCPRSALLGGGLAGVGILLLLLGMLHLWKLGGGLPMNAFPPQHFVTEGVYSLMPQPIYTGFVMVCLGLSIATGSAAGLWLVSPAVALGCAALVLGYERQDLAERFGRGPLPLLPQAGTGNPSARDRLACYLFVFLPWAALYEAVIYAGPSPDGRVVQFPFERSLPVYEWAEVFYFSAYVVTALAPLFAGTRNDLRRFCLRALFAMALAFPCYLVLPLIGPARVFVPRTAPGRLLAWERTLDGAAGAFPSFHVIWAVLAGELLASRWKRAAWLWRMWAAVVSVACVAAGQHPIIDVVGGFATVAAAVRASRIWDSLRNGSECIANSWREWRIGPVRVINHGFYVGAGGLLAFWIAASAAGPEGRAPVLLAALLAVVGAGLWAQYIEGSPQLLRPYGFYGGLLGGTLGALLAPLFGTSVWVVLAAFSFGGPLAQAMGRLRCLVQGCCHGRPAPAAIGIRYVHPRSRVTRMTAWGGAPIHPTPLYSILWNLVTLVVIARLWSLSAPLHLIAGVYFILNGLGRFVEEAWRGEPQTPVHYGLRLYQWAAVLSVLTGILMTALGDSGPAPTPRFDWSFLVPSAGFGLVVCCAMGVDFPESGRRFSRLT